MNRVADSSSLNKPIKINLNICMHIFYFFIFVIFGLGPAQPTWAGLDPASPAWSLAQASDQAGLSNMRALTHACCFIMQLN
jgi:hypothetical protein